MIKIASMTATIAIIRNFIMPAPNFPARLLLARISHQPSTAMTDVTPFQGLVLLADLDVCLRAGTRLSAKNP